MKETFEDIEMLFTNVLQSKSQEDEDSEMGDFFEMGGDSIKALSLAAKIKDMGYDVDIREIMSAKSLDLLLDNIMSKKGNTEWQTEQLGEIKIGCALTDKKNSLSVRAFAFSREVYNQALSVLFERHDVLRTVYEDSKYLIKSYEEYMMCQDKENLCFLSEHYQKDGKDYIVFALDKSVSDIVSLKIIFEDFTYYYSQIMEQKALEKKEKTAPFSSWLNLLNKKVSNYQYYENIDNKKHFLYLEKGDKSFEEELSLDIDPVNELNLLHVLYRAFSSVLQTKEYTLRYYYNNRQYPFDELDFERTVGAFEQSVWIDISEDNTPGIRELKLLALRGIPSEMKDADAAIRFVETEFTSNEYFGEARTEASYYMGEKIFVTVEKAQDRLLLKVTGKEKYVKEFVSVFKQEAKRDIAEEEPLQAIDFGANDLTKTEFSNICSHYGKENIEKIYRLLGMQKGMLYHNLENESSNQYKMQYHIKLDFYMDVELVKLAIETIASKYAVLRTAIVYKGLKEPVQVILSNRKPVIEVIQMETDMTEDLLNEYIERDLNRPLDLEEDSLFRVTILNNNRYINMIWNFHHIIVDGWCMPIIFSEFSAMYENLLLGDEIIYQKKYVYEKYVDKIYSSDIRSGISYFQKELDGYDGDTKIVPLTESPVITEEKLRYSCIINPGTSALVKELAFANEITINTVVETAFGIALQKFCHTDDVVFGKVVSGRNVNLSGIEAEVGLCVNTIPVRVQGEDLTVKELLIRQQQNNLRAMPYHFCPLSEINKALKRNVINILYVYENYYQSEELNKQQEGISFRNLRDDTNYDITMIVTNYGELKFDLVYNAGRYQLSEIKRLMQAVELILEQMCANPDINTRKLVFTGDEEKKKILSEFNDTTVPYARNASIMQLFKESVKQFGKKNAIVSKSKCYTYEELDRLSNRVARTLIKEGVKKNQCVAVVAHKSAETIIAICGILKAGAAYVPVDPMNPEERINYILDDCEAVKVLSGEKLIYDEDDSECCTEVYPEDWAYLMYTSGTKGKPKATMVTQRNVVRLVNHSTFLPLNEDTVILQTGSIAFDASTFEIWGTLLNGGLLCMAELEDIIQYDRLKQAIQDYHVNTMWVTTSLFNQLVAQKPDIFGKLTYLAIGGEKLSEKHVRTFMECNKYVKLYNGYGPTENTTFTTMGEIPRDFDKISIGKPISNTTVYILNGDELCPVGVYGELCTGGDGVAEGYYKQKELTAENFVQNPFGEGRMYRTKDMARWLENGEIEYLRRMDSQLKIRGFRIELEEIEKEILNYSAIEQSVVIVDDKKNLMAYYTSPETVDTESLFLYLKKSLPDYMIPRYYMQIDKIPINQNGKLDKKELPFIPEPIRQKYVAPENAAEEKIVRLFSNILQVERVGLLDDFFELGGNSLLAVRLANGIESEFGVRVKIKDVMQNKTPLQISELLDNISQSEEISIPKAEKKALYRMSSVQQRMYIVNQMDASGILYNIPVLLQFEKRIDVLRMQQVFIQLIKRHEALRTTFLIEEGTFYQKIEEEFDFEIEQIQEEEINRAAEAFIRPFDLSKAPLLRVGVIHAEQDYLIMDMHHIISDGTSENILIKEMFTLYMGGSLPEVSVQYKDYSEWFAKQDLQEQKEFWMGQFADGVPVLNLPTDYPRKNIQSFKGESVSRFIEENGLRAFANKNNITEYIVFLSALMVLLSRYSRQEDIVIGSALAARTHRCIEDTVGMFVNTLPFRAQPAGEKRLCDFVEEIKELAVHVFENQDYPFMDIVDSIATKRDPSRQPLFDILLVYQNESDETGMQNMGAVAEEFHSKVSKFDMTVNISNSKNGYQVTIEYCKELYKQKTILHMLDEFEVILQKFTSVYEKTIDEIEIITEEDKEKILHVFNHNSVDYPSEKSLGAVFLETVEQYSDNAAIASGETVLTYAELDKSVNRLAARLQKAGIKPEDFVAVEAKKVVQTVIAILAVNRLGAAYIPVDMNNPKEKIEYILEDSGAKIILYYGDKRWETEIEEIDISDCDSAEETKQEACEVQGNALSNAYLMYTSGTTGNPKATVVMHKNIMRLVKNNNFVPLNESTRILLTGSIAFDASTLEIWGALLNGGCLHLVETDVLVDPDILRTYIVEKSINTMWMTSSLFNQMILVKPDVFDSLSYLMIGGEKLSDKHVRLFLERKNNVKLINGYGPTENTTFTTTYTIPKNFDVLYIGKPINNTQVYIMHKNTLCGIHVYGELCTAGDGVAKGYWNQEKLTNEKFVQNPFGAGMLYRTGDIARFSEDGNIEFLGRMDSQVKIRGFRIEMDGIEKQIMHYDGIERCAIIVDDDKQLKAYFTAKEYIDISSLFEWLKTQLPDYMVPRYYMQLEKLPVTMNGKLDYKALPAIDVPIRSMYVAPNTQLEYAVTELFQKVLNVEKVGMKDSFFDLGGHSLKATMLVNAIEEYSGVRLLVSDILENPTPENLCSIIANREEKTYASIEKAKEKPYYSMSQEQKRIYILCQLDKNGILYNMPVFMRAQSKLDRQRVNSVFLEIINRHESLRTGFFMEDGFLYQKVFDMESILFNVESGDRKTFVRPFHLSEAPLIRVGIEEAEEDILLIDIHHIAADGASISIILNEFLSLYFGKEVEDNVLQYRDYSEWMINRKLNDQKEYWLSRFKDGVSPANMLTDYPRQNNRSFKGRSLARTLDASLTKRIKKTASDQGMTEYMILLSAAMIMLARYTYSEEIIIGCPIANRTHKELEKVVGMFVNTIALKGEPARTKLVKTFLQEIKKECLNAYKNQEYPFEKLVEEIGVQREISRNPLFDVMLVLQNNINLDDLEEAGFSYVESDNKVSKFDITINVEEYRGQYLVNFEYCVDLYEESTINHLFDNFCFILENLGDSVDKPVMEMGILSEEEKSRILNEFNRPVDMAEENAVCMHEMFMQQVKKDKQKTAIIYGDSAISYEQLDVMSDYFAGQLWNNQVKQGDFVCIVGKRTPMFIVGILAILKVGAVYVPVDAGNPLDRIIYIISDCNAAAVLTDDKIAGLEEYNPIVLDSNLCVEKVEKPKVKTNIRDLAYCIYTSGTTGKPKGVLIEHIGVYNLRQYFLETHQISREDRALQFANFVFDASVSEMCMSIFSGATMIMVPEEIKRDYVLLEQYIKEKEVTIGILPPQYLNFIQLPGMRTVISAGSETNYNLVCNHSKDKVYSNDYGPTETTVCATYWKHLPKQEIPFKIPIGKPMCNKNVYILNGDMLCGIYEPGELCIAGVGIARGYLNNAELTNEKFVPDPFREGRMYRSGDLARWLPDGNIDYLGRIDNQVKIRGFRVELQEIENVINSLEEVELSAVITHEQSKDKQMILAFYESENDDCLQTIRSRITKELPHYMIPSKIMRIDKIPFNTSGKVNKNKLIEYYQEYIKQEKSEYGSETYTDSQNYVLYVWRKILEEHEIGLDDDFFEMGGNSLDLFKVKSEFEAGGIEVSISELYQYPTIRTLCEQVVDKQTDYFVIDLNSDNHVSYKMLPEIKENTDTFSWEELNCYYKPIAIVLDSFGTNYFNIFCMCVSFYHIYQIENYFIDFSPSRRQDNLMNFYQKILEEELGVEIQMELFRELPDEEEFKHLIINNINQKIPMVIAGDSSILYYSSDYMSRNHSHYFIVKGYDETKDLVYIIDNLQYERGSEAIYKEFVITFDMLYRAVSSYNDNLLLNENEAYMLKFISEKKKTENRTANILNHMLEKLGQIQEEKIKFEYIEIAFKDYILNNKDKLEAMDSNERMNFIAYISSLTNMKNVFFYIFLDLFEMYCRENDIVRKLREDKEEIIKLWSKAHICILDIMAGEAMDYDEVAEVFENAVRKEAEFRQILLNISSELSEISDCDVQTEYLLKGDLYLENPSHADISFDEKDIVFELSDQYRYDMWLEDVNAVRIGKDYEEAFNVEASIRIIKNSGDCRYQDGIAVHISNGITMMYGIVCSSPDLHRLSIYCPNLKEYVLYEETFGDDLARIKVVYDHSYIIFMVMKNNVWRSVKRIKCDEEKVSVEIFSRTWEKRAHKAVFEDVDFS